MKPAIATGAQKSTGTAIANASFSIIIVVLAYLVFTPTTINSLECEGIPAAGCTLSEKYNEIETYTIMVYSEDFYKTSFNTTLACINYNLVLYHEFAHVTGIRNETLADDFARAHFNVSSCRQRS